MKYYFSIAIVFLSHFCHAQKERGITREANNSYNKRNYTDAEVDYKKALAINKNFAEAMFGLGDAMYDQKRYDEAIKQFEQAEKTLKDTAQKAQAMHNIGNAYMQLEKYDEAINAYKKALKYNPKDRDTKYNLAYANLKKKEQQEKKNQQQKQPNQQNQQQKPQEGNQPKEAKGSLTNEQAEKILEALKNAEQKTQEKVQKKEGKPNERKREKDW